MFFSVIKWFWKNIFLNYISWIRQSQSQLISSSDWRKKNHSLSDTLESSVFIQMGEENNNIILVLGDFLQIKVVSTSKYSGSIQQLISLCSILHVT